jgi:hypothetical protein
MNGHDILVSLFSSLVGIIIAGIVAALTGLPKKWVDSVIDNRFKVKQDELNRAHQEKLSQLNHEYQTQFEHVRSEIQRTFSRMSKVHEQEYKVLPQSWFHLQHAFGTSWNTMFGFTTTIRFSTMTDTELDEFLETQPFSATQKAQIKGAADAEKQQELYFDAVRVTGLDQMTETQRVFRNYLIKKSVFMNKGVYEAFDAVSLKLIQANTQFTSGDEAMKRNGQKQLAELKPEIDALLTTIQNRLYVDHA